MFNESDVAPVTRDRLYEQVAQRIQELILADERPPGSKIPTEREMGEQFGVSRTVIREALKALSERGLVTIRPGRGAYVADPVDSALSEPIRLLYQLHNFSYDNLVEVRRVLEVEIAGMAAERALPDQLEKMRSAVAEMDQHFHVTLAEATQNAMFPILIGSIGGLVHESRQLIFGVRGSPHRGQSYHRALLEAVERRDVVAARRAMRDHLAQVEADIQAVSQGENPQGTEGGE
ncbi:MAG TPA: FadR/GntR family transcriptional regulator [Chloroflexota bacterium]|nr:FadR/GntR family transcriptional regulator [Chloroflexota bacterium]